MKNPVKPLCTLVGKNGNIFYILGQVSEVLKSSGMEIEAKEVCDKVMKARSYDEALRIVMEYVEISIRCDIFPLTSSLRKKKMKKYLK